MIATVAIPHYKSVSSLKRLLSALDNQKLLDFNLKEDIKVIVVNDDLEIKLNSKDFKYKNLNLKIINQYNQGVASARNKAILSAEGKFIFFLDVDCIPTNSWLQNMMKAFNERLDIDAVGGMIEPFITKGLVNNYYNYTNRLKQPIVDRETGEIVTIITANCGFRLDKIRKIGGFDQKSFYKISPGGEDVDLTYRFKKAGFKIIYNSDVIALHEYPKKISTIFNKYSNYGKGMKIYCLARNIDPKIIRQPRLNLMSLIVYNLNIINTIKKSFSKYKMELSLSYSIVFTFFDSIRHIAHGYGYFFKR